LFHGSQASPACPFGNSNMPMKINMEQWGNDNDRENRSTRRRTRPSATLSTIDLTWTGLGSNPGHSSERPATNRLSVARL
jgi:hypothetical protein